MTTIQAVSNENQLLVSRLLAAREETDAIFREVMPEAMYDRRFPSGIASFSMSDTSKHSTGICCAALRAPVLMRSSIGSSHSALIL